MQAALPMYDLVELRDATCAWWDAIARHAGVAADLLSPDDLTTHWTAPDLLFSQTCGYPLTHALAGRVRYLATPRYAAEGCDGPLYRSAVLVREASALRTFADASGKKVAINGFDSQSGCNVLRAMAARTSAVRPFFGGVVVTGSHAASLMAVVEARAELAAVDCVTLALLRAVRPTASTGLRAIAWSTAAPSLPYITGLRTSNEVTTALAHGLASAAADPALASVRRRLLIDGVSVLDPSAYAVIPVMRVQARSAGLDELDGPHTITWPR